MLKKQKKTIHATHLKPQKPRNKTIKVQSDYCNCQVNINLVQPSLANRISIQYKTEHRMINH